jgi:hypothetical protein
LDCGGASLPARLISAGFVQILDFQFFNLAYKCEMLKRESTYWV